MYKAIHAAGVSHEDVDWRHILVRGEGKPSANVLDPAFDPENLVLIDWNMSEVRNKESDEVWQRNAEEELCVVATRLREYAEDIPRSQFEEDVLRREQERLAALSSDDGFSDSDDTNGDR